MPELAIIADDLTGALDAAAPFAVRGISAAVALSVDALPEAIATGSRIVSVSTDSREISADAARNRVRQAVTQLPSGQKIFKKIDSRLKGNIAAELDAIQYQTSLVIPAIPAFDRWTRDGKLGGFGVPEPINIAQTLGEHHAMARIPDVETDADIDNALADNADLCVGARGLSEAIARSMAPKGATPISPARQTHAYCVIGSTDPITLAQLDYLRQTYQNIRYIAAPNGIAPVTAPAEAGLTIIHATPGEVPATGPQVATSLGQSLLQLAPAEKSLLILSGGVTAQLVLEQLGIRMLKLVGEALPGLPLARAGDYTVITKSGGFGDKDTLSRLVTQYCSVGS